MAEQRTEQSVAELRAEVARLNAALGTSESKRTEAEQMAEAMSQAGQFLVGGDSEAQPTGKTITVEKCLNPWVRDEKKQKFIDVELPTFFYTIQLPAGAGLSLNTNGIEYYHGQTYEFDSETLAEMKHRVSRCWDHEKSIHGDNENAYRKPTHRRIGARA